MIDYGQGERGKERERDPSGPPPLRCLSNSHAFSGRFIANNKFKVLQSI